MFGQAVVHAGCTAALSFILPGMSRPPMTGVYIGAALPFCEAERMPYNRPCPHLTVHQDHIIGPL